MLHDQTPRIWEHDFNRTSGYHLTNLGTCVYDQHLVFDQTHRYVLQNIQWMTDGHQWNLVIKSTWPSMTIDSTNQWPSGEGTNASRNFQPLWIVSISNRFLTFRKGHKIWMIFQYFPWKPSSYWGSIYGTPHGILHHLQSPDSSMVRLVARDAMSVLPMMESGVPSQKEYPEKRLPFRIFFLDFYSQWWWTSHSGEITSLSVQSTFSAPLSIFILIPVQKKAVFAVPINILDG